MQYRWIGCRPICLLPLHLPSAPLFRRDSKRDSPIRREKRISNGNVGSRRCSRTGPTSAGPLRGAADWRRPWRGIRTGNRRTPDSRRTCARSGASAAVRPCRNASGTDDIRAAGIPLLCVDRKPGSSDSRPDTSDRCTFVGWWQDSYRWRLKWPTGNAWGRRSTDKPPAVVAVMVVAVAGHRGNGRSGTVCGGPGGRRWGKDRRRCCTYFCR